jgi:hypothetical protein
MAEDMEQIRSIVGSRLIEESRVVRSICQHFFLDRLDQAITPSVLDDLADIILKTNSRKALSLKFLGDLLETDINEEIEVILTRHKGENAPEQGEDNSEWAEVMGNDATNPLSLLILSAQNKNFDNIKILLNILHLGLPQQAHLSVPNLNASGIRYPHRYEEVLNHFIHSEVCNLNIFATMNYIIYFGVKEGKLTLYACQLMKDLEALPESFKKHYALGKVYKEIAQAQGNLTIVKPTKALKHLLLAQALYEASHNPLVYHPKASFDYGNLLNTLSQLYRVGIPNTLAPDLDLAADYAFQASRWGWVEGLSNGNSLQLLAQQGNQKAIDYLNHPNLNKFLNEENVTLSDDEEEHD